MSGSKLLRLFSLFLCLLLCLANFSVVANAAEDENLVDSNITNWIDFGEESEYFQSATVQYLDNDVNHIKVSSSDKTVLLFDMTEFLKIGESYNFSFSLPTTSDKNSSALNSCELVWTLTDGGGDLYPSVGSDIFQVIVDKNNKSNYLGKTTTYEFTYTQGFKNTFLCLFISPGDDVSAYDTLELYISDVKLERVSSESEKKLDGILGWLQDIWDKLSSIGDKLTDVWTNITASVTDLGDRISGFFDNLITNVKTFFEELPRKIFNYEIEVTDDDIISDGSGSGEEEEEEKPIVSMIGLDTFNFVSGRNVECSYNSDNEVYFNFVGYASYASYDSNSNTWLKNFFDANRTYRITFKINNWQEPSYSASNLSYCYLKVNTTEDTYYINYNGNGVYTLDITTLRSNDLWLTFSIGNAYEFTLSDFAIYDITDGVNSGDTGSDEEGTTTKVSWFQYLINKFKSWFTSIIDSVKGFFIKLVDDIKGLFIPPDGFFEEWKAKFDLMLSDNLGFIYQAPNFVIDIVEVVQEILQSDQEVNLVFPAVEFDIAGYHIELFKDTKVDFSFLEAGIWLTLYSMYKVMLYVIFALALIKYGMSTWERTMAN